MRQKATRRIAGIIVSILVIVVVVFGLLRGRTDHEGPYEHPEAEVHEEVVQQPHIEDEHKEEPHVEQVYMGEQGSERPLSGTVVDGVRVIEIAARQFEFEPKEVVVVEGERVRLEVTSEDVTHGIGIENYKIKRRLEPGKTEAIIFVADKPGKHHFHCSVYCGSGHGEMHGELVVLSRSR